MTCSHFDWQMWWPSWSLKFARYLDDFGPTQYLCVIGPLQMRWWCAHKDTNNDCC